MNDWKQLQHEKQLEEIIRFSAHKPQVIFKHSTRCSTSFLAKSRLEKNFFSKEIDFYFLDLLVYRSLSDKIAEVFKVYHESPQVLLIKNGECVYDESHLSIQMDEILEQAFCDN
ncbi:MAG TPA: bacillithiol system redox-active protein YtxJ [Chitinophagaceae bacterium]|nr:bacillithiol system redox-active protein YtxJ [Chitinophagaceae bacterium]